ncbi:hypothetical protein, conserved [Eimeria brunetti]|uniref:Dual specificity phosphatase, catalytic domain-containing protein n=1 Tax=Eimeria brunetti TaxID=51314 RepID=U6LU19_9EIME|nr:hypothetical protein, conserved [Eimeria brunetti]
MGGVGSTVQFERAPEFCTRGGGTGPTERRYEAALPVSASSAKRRPPMSLWITQEGDKTLDAVIHALRLWGGSTQQVAAPETLSRFSSSSGCLLEHHQLLLAWRMSRIGAPGRCGCCESLLPLGGPMKGAPGTRDAPEEGFRRPCSSSSTSMHSSTPTGDASSKREGKGGQEKGSWRQVVGAGAPQPDPSSCYLVIHAYTAAQQQQQQQSMSHIPEGPRGRRRSITPPRFPSPTGVVTPPPPITEKAQCIASSSRNGSTFVAAAEMLSEDLAHLLTQAETHIAAETRRHSVWHAVHLCACCLHSQQQQQAKSGAMSRSRTGSADSHKLPSTQPGNHSGEQQHQKEQQQLQQQHLWAVYLWEGLEAPRYILDHARLRTLRLVEALESCEQRGVPISPEVLLPWASFAVLRPPKGGPRCLPTVEVCRGGDALGNPEEQQPVILDGEALLKRNVLLLRMLLRLPRLACGASPTIPAVCQTAVAASEPAGATEPTAAAATTATSLAATASVVVQDSQGEEQVVVTSPKRPVQEAQWQRLQQEDWRALQEQQQQQESRSAHTVPFVPRLAIPSKGLPRLQLQPQGSSPKFEEPRLPSGSSSYRRGPTSRAGSQRYAVEHPVSDTSSLASSVSASPVSSPGEMSPAEGQGRGQRPQRVPSGPLRLQGGLRLQGVPKLAIPRLGGGGEQSSSAAATAGAGAAGPYWNPQTRGREDISPLAIHKEGEGFNSRRSSATSPSVPQAAPGGGDSFSSREPADASLLRVQQPSQQQQTAPAGARLSGVSARSPGDPHPSGLLCSPAASPGGLQLYNSDGSNTGSSRESYGSRRRRTDEVRSNDSAVTASGRSSRRNCSSSCSSSANNSDTSDYSAQASAEGEDVKAAVAARVIFWELIHHYSAPEDDNSSCMLLCVALLCLLQEGMGLYSRTRQQQLFNFRRVISDVYEGRLFVSGAAAACDLECLRRAGITHVVNTIGDICPNVFASLLTYKTYYLKDTRQQDIMCVFYDCIRFISEAIDERGDTATGAAAAAGVSPAFASGAGSPTGSNRTNKGSDHSNISGGSSSKKPHKVLIHCKEGVSRSATLAIAFLMWRLQLPFAEAFERMRNRRAICSPNTGFTFQLLLLQKRLGLRHPRAPIPNVDLAAAKDRQEAHMSPSLPELPPSPDSSRRCTTPGKGTKRVGSPLESPFSPSAPSASGCPSPGATGPLAPPSSITSLDLSAAGRLADKTSTERSPLEVDDEGAPPRGLGPRAPRICAPPRPGGDRGEATDTHPQGDSPLASTEAPAAVPPLPPLPAPTASAVAVVAAAAGTSSAVEDCVLLLHLVVHSAHSPDFLLWSEMTEWQPGVLPLMAEQGVYMLRGGYQAWVWMDSSKCLRKTAEVEEAARNYQENVALVERRNIQLHYTSPGSEPPAFWLTLGIKEGTAHLGAPNLLSGLEPMVPEKSEEPFRWRDYCAFDLPADWAGMGSSEGAFVASGTSEDSPVTQGPSVVEGAGEGPRRPCEGPSGEQQNSSNTSSRESSRVPSVRRSLELFGTPAEGAPSESEARRAAAGTVAAKNAKGAARLFCFPDLEEPLDLFDSEDLLPDRVFLLLAEGSGGSGSETTDAPMPSSSPATATDTVRAWLWVGAEAAFDLERDPEVVRAQVMEAFKLQPGQLQFSLEVSACQDIAAPATVLRSTPGDMAAAVAFGGPGQSRKLLAVGKTFMARWTVTGSSLLRSFQKREKRSSDLLFDGRRLKKVCALSTVMQQQLQQQQQQLLLLDEEGEDSLGL